MSGDVAQPLTTVPEIILKKRKSNEELALRRREQLEQRKFRQNKSKQEFIKKPDDFVKEFRYRVCSFILDFTRDYKSQQHICVVEDKCCICAEIVIDVGLIL